MFYEEKVIDGVLMFRNTRFGVWKEKVHIVDMESEIDNRTALSFLILENAKVRGLTSTEDFDPNHLTIDLKVNGIDFSPEDFNEIVERWEKHYIEHVKEKLDFLKTEQAVGRKAKQIIDEKLGNVREVLDHVESNLWMLEE